MPGGRTKKWKPIYLVHVYRLMKAGLPKVDICRQLGVDPKTYERWREGQPDLRAVLRMVEQEKTDTASLQDWVYRRLKPELKEIWDAIRLWSSTPNGVIKIEEMLARQGKHVRQQLFLHALCVSHFSPSEALRKVNLARSDLYDWIEHDPGFAELVKEIEWHKANFFEEALVKLVRAGDAAAVIFANRTFNKGRGFSPSSTLDVNVNGNVAVGVLDLAELLPYLSNDCKLEVLGALRQREEAQQTARLQHQPQLVLAVEKTGSSTEKESSYAAATTLVP